jgi:gliding motility-associated-like protein
MKSFSTILILLFSYTASSQLYVNGGADIFKVTGGGSLTVNGDLVVGGTSNFRIFDQGAVTVTGNALINGGTLRNGDNQDGGSQLNIQGNIINNSSLINNGTLSLGGNWNTNNMFNGVAGTIALTGVLNQTIGFNGLQTANLRIDKGGFATYTGDELTILEDVNFQRGVMVIDQPTRFVVTANATVSGGSVDSYLQGYMTNQGSGNKFFPLGYQGEYGPLTILEVFGTNPEYTASYINPNTSNPAIDTTIPLYDQLMGLSNRGLWQVTLSGASVLSTLPDQNIGYEITYENESYPITNPIRHSFRSPVIASARTASGLFGSLGVQTFVTTDSLTRGTISSEFAVDLNDQTKFTLGGNGEKTFFLAIGLAPRINPEGLYYIADVFSPSASDVNNQTFKVFGEKIEESDFQIQIYNRFGAIVYQERSFSAANQIGWDGVNQKTKREEPTGTYFYFVKLLKENGEVIQQRGSFYLIR